MAFLDNSGDIILDAVLTDTGRYRLSKGDGTFKIAKFALGDEEINYGNYNTGSASGSAYYDLDILQTPILEAFTNNASTMKTQLISIPRTDLLFLPVLRINNVFPEGSTSGDTALVASYNSYFVTCNDATTTSTVSMVGVQDGTLATVSSNGSIIMVDQGLDTTQIPYSFNIDQQLKETQYIVQIDSRLGQLANTNGNTGKNPSFVDDDSIAFYYFSLNTDNSYVSDITDTTNPEGVNSTIAGPRGTRIKFRIKASAELMTSDYLFTKLGGTFTFIAQGGPVSEKYIDTFVRVTGATTGYSIDLPVRFIKNA
jgi:hypothetical protein